MLFNKVSLTIFALLFFLVKGDSTIAQDPCSPNDSLGQPQVVPDCCATKSCQTQPTNDICKPKDDFGMPLVVPDCCPNNCDGNDDPFEVRVLPYPVPSCGNNTSRACKYVCNKKPHCQDLNFNRTEIPCGCPAQICPNGKIYASYSNKPLTAKQLAKQPHVRATCFANGCVPAAIAPHHKQIGICTPPQGSDPQPSNV